MIKAIIFDCFGVLVGRGFDETYRVAGGNPEKDRDFVHDILTQANRGIISRSDFRRAVAEKLGISMERWREAVKQSEQPNGQLLGYIRTLKKDYKTAILSNVNSGVLEQKIDLDTLNKCFDELVISADVGFMKPEPEAYTHTANKLGVDTKECVFIDDNEGFVRAAESQGMRGIVYKDFEQMKRELTEVLGRKA